MEIYAAAGEGKQQEGGRGRGEDETRRKNETAKYIHKYT